MADAQALTTSFYQDLFQDGQVDKALNVARAAQFKPDSFDWAIPVLFMRLSEGRLFERLPETPPLKSFEPETVCVPAGRFKLGSAADLEKFSFAMPQHSVELPATASAGTRSLCGNMPKFIKRERAQPVPNDRWRRREPPGRLLDHPATDVSLREQAEKLLDHPVTDVSSHDTVAYCRWLSATTGRRYRLPAEAEWERAAGRSDGRRYPWGDAWDTARVNVGSAGTTPVAAHPAGASPYGCEDMLGNVQEWTATLWSEGSTLSLACADEPLFDPGDLPSQAWMVHKGGSYLSEPEELSSAAHKGALHSSKIPWRVSRGDGNFGHIGATSHVQYLG